MRRKKETVASDISKYLVKQPTCDEPDCVASSVSVPCPDDAALPCPALSSITSEAIKSM